MSRRERKRERHRLRRQERRKQLRCRRQEMARQRVRVTNPPAPARGLGAGQWRRFRVGDPQAYVGRAREMFPLHRCARHFDLERLHAPSDTEADTTAGLLKLALSTMAGDPPWAVPEVMWRRENGRPIFQAGFLRPCELHDPDLGRIGHWGWRIALPGSAETPVWFTPHAIERLTYRTRLDRPDLLWSLADTWMSLLKEDSADGPFVRELVSQDGIHFATVRMPACAGGHVLGRFPLVPCAGRLVAKTFLEPWMSIGDENVCATHAKRRRGAEEYRVRVVPDLHALAHARAIERRGAETHAVSLAWLARAWEDRPCPSRRWVGWLRSGLEFLRAGATDSARRLLQRGLGHHDAEWARLPERLREEHGGRDSTRVAEARLAFASLCSARTRVRSARLATAVRPCAGATAKVG